MRLIAIAGIVTGLTLGAAGSVSAAVLHQQYPLASEFTTPTVTSHDYADDSRDARAADDFTVGDGQVWTIHSVDALGTRSTTTSHTVTVAVFTEASRRPGVPVFSQSGIPLAECCNLTARLASAPALKPATYWLSVQTAGESAWAWQVHPPDSTYGGPAVWENPGNASARNCTSWRPLIECGLVAASDGKDFVFALNGTLIDSRFSVVALTAKRARLLATVSLPATGSMRVGGKGVRRATKQLTDGEHRLRIRLKSTVLDRLRSGRKARVRVRLTFTATGGDAYTQATKATLVPLGRAGAFRLGR